MTSPIETSTAEYRYVKTIGNAAAPGQIGFRNPVDVALGKGGLLYVLSHAAENTPNGKRVAKCTFEKEYFLGEFGSFGDEKGQFTWPNSVAVDRDGNVYVTDEWLHRVSVFDADGRFLYQWGTPGDAEGQWNRPAGITFDHQDNLLVVDSMNHRIQKYSKDGRFITQWGGLVLQFPLSSQAATAMACLGYLLVPTLPAGPANDLRWRVSRDPQEADQESTDLRDSERDVLWAGQRPLLAAPTANTARATRVRVIWRYQSCPLRNSL